MLNAARFTAKHIDLRNWSIGEAGALFQTLRRPGEIRAYWDADAVSRKGFWMLSAVPVVDAFACAPTAAMRSRKHASGEKC